MSGGQVPKIEPSRLSAVEACRAIAAGDLTVEALVRSCLERIDERESDVQAWVHLARDLAVDRARAVDRSAPRGPLSGLPIGVKDVIDTADLPTEHGSPIYQGHQPLADAACVALARRAGAIVLGKTVTAEFASRQPGPTHNPHHLGHTPGGSSSGSAAAVADFMVPLAFGTQTGGSVIRPAAYCGVVGYKPTFGTINAEGVKHFAESLDTVGVFGRTVEDCALLAGAVAPRDLDDLAPARANRLRVGLCRTSRWDEVTLDAQAALESAASALAADGFTVVDLDLPPDFDALHQDQLDVMNFEAAQAFAWELDHHADQLSSYLRATLREWSGAEAGPYLAQLAHASDCRARFATLVSDLDVVLTPSAPGPAPAGLGSTGSPLCNRVWTLLGLPCVTVPAGRDSSGLPLGVQVVADHGADLTALQAAAAFSRVLA